jgi:hypothetical protein
MLSAVVKVDKVRTPAVTFKLDKETLVLSIYGHFTLFNTKLKLSCICGHNNLHVYVYNKNFEKV